MLHMVLDIVLVPIGAVLVWSIVSYFTLVCLSPVVACGHTTSMPSGAIYDDQEAIRLETRHPRPT